MKQFEVEAEQSGEQLTLRFSGFLNEEADFTQIPESQAQNVALNLEQLEGSNSLGLKKWISWITPVSQTAQITIEKAPPEIVNQMSILSGFVPKGAKVSSIFVPYYCDSCGHEENILFENGSGFVTGTAETKPGYRIDDRPCTQCGADAEADVLPEAYFKFLFQK